MLLYDYLSDMIFPGDSESVGGEGKGVRERERKLKRGLNRWVIDSRPCAVYYEKECCCLFYGSALFYRLLSVVCCDYSSGH